MWADNHKAKAAAYMREWRKTHPMNAEQRRKDNARCKHHLYLHAAGLAA